MDFSVVKRPKPPSKKLENPQQPSNGAPQPPPPPPPHVGAPTHQTPFGPYSEHTDAARRWRNMNFGDSHQNYCYDYNYGNNNYEYSHYPSRVIGAHNYDHHDHHMLAGPPHTALPPADYGHHALPGPPPPPPRLGLPPPDYHHGPPPPAYYYPPPYHGGFFSDENPNGCIIM